MTTAACIDRVPAAYAVFRTDHELETERLLLRVVESDDLERYLRLMTDPAVMKFIGLEEGKIPSDEEIGTIVAGAVRAWSTRGYGRWSVFDRLTNEFIGFAGFRCEGGVPELITVVHERFWGNGFAREAARAVIDHGFAMLGFREVCSFTRPANTRARNLLDNLGAEFVGYVDFHGIDGAEYRIQPSTN